MNTVVDFRARPNLDAYARYLLPRLDAIDRTTGGRYGVYRAPVDTVDGFVERMDAAGIGVAVFAARSRASTGDWPLTNALVADSARRHPGRLVPLGGIDIADPDKAVEEIRRCVEHHGMPGVCFDPFQEGLRADDDHLSPLYASCEELGVMAVVTLGALPGVPAPLSCGDPLAVDAVAERFPELLLVASHAGWPFTQEMIAVAWRHRNVFFENSYYHFAPGADVLVDAANRMVGHKMLYASAYPFSPLEETVERFTALPFDASVRDEVMAGNALSLLARCGWTP